MREFCKFSPKFWMNREMGRLIEQGPEVGFISLYLQTNHHSHSLGIYFIPLDYIARDTRIKIKKVEEIMQVLIEANFCKYDYSHQYIWIMDYATDQNGGPLKKGDNRIVQIQKYFEELPKLSFLHEFYQQYGGDFHLEPPSQGISDREDTILPLPDRPAKPLRSKEKETKTKEKEKEKEKEKKKENEKGNITSCEVVSEASPVDKIFDHWKSIMNHPNAQLDKSRRKLIRKALEDGYDEAQLCQAITGCSFTPHNMGFNENGQRYDGLHIIFRNGDQIDRFIGNYNAPPKKMSKHDELVRHNKLAIQTWLKQSEDPLHEH